MRLKRLLKMITSDRVFLGTIDNRAYIAGYYAMLDASSIPELGIFEDVSAMRRLIESLGYEVVDMIPSSLVRVYHGGSDRAYSPTPILLHRDDEDLVVYAPCSASATTVSYPAHGANVDGKADNNAAVLMRRDLHTLFDDGIIYRSGHSHVIYFDEHRRVFAASSLMDAANISTHTL